MDRSHDEKTIESIAKTPHLELVRVGRWSFARRPHDLKVVAVVAVTGESKLILVEQFRVPVNGRVIELPAGLAGDAEDPNESLQTAAERELLEETGYVADAWSELATVTSSAGLTNEQVTVFRADGLKRQATGGGVEGEDIAVHEVSVSELEPWLNEQTASGKMIDSRVYASIHWATK